MQEIERLARRHVAKCLGDLDRMRVPQMVKYAVKKHFYHFSKDVIEHAIPDALKNIPSPQLTGSQSCR